MPLAPEQEKAVLALLSNGASAGDSELQTALGIMEEEVVPVL